MDALLDVNALVALFWPRHDMHPAVSEWFRRHRETKRAWATCALTEAGFVRVLANPAVSQGALSIPRITAILEGNRHTGHQFWAMNMNWSEALQLSGIEVGGHQQVTDAYLIGLAVKNKGRLVTLDKALGKLSKHVLVLGQPDRVQKPGVAGPSTLR